MNIDWSAALEAIAADIITIAGQQPKERLPQGEQVCSILSNWFRSIGAGVAHLEAGYLEADSQRSHLECDLRVVFDDGREIWIEIKGGTADVPGYFSKPAESLYGWLSDVEKLHNAPDTAAHALVVIGLRQHGHAGKLFSPRQLEQVTKAIKGSFETPDVELIKKEVPFEAWRDIKPAEVVAHAWVW